MTRFVLDNSVVMRWLLTTKAALAQHYAESVFQSLADNAALVPNLWHLEVVSVLLDAEKRQVVSAAESEIFISRLKNLPIQVDSLTAQQAFVRTLGIARSYALSSYDAAYLELAIREGLPLATLDQRLVKAAKKSAVGVYLEV